MPHIHTFIVSQQDLVRFGDKDLHPVCATFTLAREIEYAGRQCILEHLSPDYEAVGTFLEITHLAPALLADMVRVEAHVTSFENREMVCRFEVSVREIMIAHGSTKQKIVSKKKLAILWQMKEL